MKVWRVQNSPTGSVVSDGLGFDDSPDAEVIALGFNRKQEYGAVGIGRHGNVLQWGYGDPPSQMTEAGRKLFLNCLHYIRRFDGRAPLVRVKAVHRLNSLRVAPVADQMRERAEKDPKLIPLVPLDVLKKYAGNPDGLVTYYRDHMEYIYPDKGQLVVDGELQALGLPSNRQPATLERLIAMLDDESHAATVRKLLARYTEEPLGTRPQWQQWFDRNKNRIYFTDVGGYKFEVVPEGYLTRPNNWTMAGASSPR